MAVYVLSSCFRASEEEPQGQSKKALKKQQKEAEKAAKKTEKQAKLVSVWLEIRLAFGWYYCLGIPVFISVLSTRTKQHLCRISLIGDVKPLGEKIMASYSAVCAVLYSSTILHF